MTRDEILAMTERQLDYAIASLMGDVYSQELGWWVQADGATSSNEDGGPLEYSTRHVCKVIGKFKLTVTPKMDATPTSSWLADRKLKGNGQLWWGFGPTIGIAVCRAVLLPLAEEQCVKA